MGGGGGGRHAHSKSMVKQHEWVCTDVDSGLAARSTLLLIYIYITKAC